MEVRKGSKSMRRFKMVHRGDAESLNLSQEIRIKLQNSDMILDNINPELIICVGGDGTLLNAFHDNLKNMSEVAFVGIHTGTLGFSTDYTKDEVDKMVEDITTKVPFIDHKRVLEADCYQGDKQLKFYALNEIRVENIVKTQPIEIEINNEYFESFRGNGICVSGQHGSTAYNRSIGGAVIYPGLDLLQMTEISGIHHRHSRSLGAPLILDANTKITLKSESFKHALLCYDHYHIHLDMISRVEIYNSELTIKFARYNYIPHLTRLNALF